MALKRGFRVVTAVNGLDAASKLDAARPDLIVTDLMMPGQGGYDSTVSMIRQEANVVEFIQKPIPATAFMSALHKHLKTAPPGTRRD